MALVQQNVRLFLGGVDRLSGSVVQQLNGLVLLCDELLLSAAQFRVEGLSLLSVVGLIDSTLLKSTLPNTSDVGLGKES
jgi:hypothetical protein